MSLKLKEFFPVTIEEKVKIRKLFNKKESDVSEDLGIIKEWLRKQPQIPTIENDDLLEIILMRNKFRIEKTKVKIDKYFTVKCVYPEIFNNIDPLADHIQEAIKHTIMVPLPKLAPNFERVIYWKMGNGINDDNFIHKDCLMYSVIYGDTEMCSDYAASQIIIFDMVHFNGTIVRKMDFAAFGKVATVYLEAFSGRQSAIHIVNANSFLDFLLSMAKPLLPAKLYSKIKIHKKLDTLYDCVSKEYLPSEIGGSGPSAVQLFDKFMVALKNEQPAILKRNSTRTDESLRIGEPPLKSTMFGVDGTFKKINLD